MDQNLLIVLVALSLLVGAVLLWWTGREPLPSPSLAELQARIPEVGDDPRSTLSPPVWRKKPADYGAQMSMLGPARNHWPARSLTSHSLTVPWKDPDTRRSPWGEKAIQATHLVWSVNTRSERPVATSHSRIVL